MGKSPSELPYAFRGQPGVNAKDEGWCKPTCEIARSLFCSKKLNLEQTYVYGHIISYVALIARNKVVMSLPLSVLHLESKLRNTNQSSGNQHSDHIVDLVSFPWVIKNGSDILLDIL